MAGFILTNISLDQSWPRAGSQPRIGYNHHQSSLSQGEIEALTLTLGRTSLGTLVTVSPLSSLLSLSGSPTARARQRWRWWGGWWWYWWWWWWRWWRWEIFPWSCPRCQTEWQPEATVQLCTVYAHLSSLLAAGCLSSSKASSTSSNILLPILSCPLLIHWASATKLILRILSRWRSTHQITEIGDILNVKKLL